MASVHSKRARATALSVRSPGGTLLARPARRTSGRPHVATAQRRLFIAPSTAALGRLNRREPLSNCTHRDATASPHEAPCLFRGYPQRRKPVVLVRPGFAAWFAAYLPAALTLASAEAIPLRPPPERIFSPLLYGRRSTFLHSEFFLGSAPASPSAGGSGLYRGLKNPTLSRRSAREKVDTRSSASRPRS